MSVLAIRSLSKTFGGVRAVNDVSFEIAQGEFLAMIGPNGAGKSTCFNMINGQLDAGFRADSFRRPRHRRARVARDLAARRRPDLSGRRNFRFDDGHRKRANGADFARARDLSPLAASCELHRDRALDLLAQVGMREAAERPSRELAYGDVKRVELAIALANEPRLLLMDEPTAGMAPRERNDLIALVKRLVVERGISVLFTEHSMDVVFAFADRIIVLARGRLIADGNAAAIRDNAQVREVYFGTGKTFAGAAP